MTDKKGGVNPEMYVASKSALYIDPDTGSFKDYDISVFPGSGKYDAASHFTTVISGSS